MSQQANKVDQRLRHDKDAAISKKVSPNKKEKTPPNQKNFETIPGVGGNFGSNQTEEDECNLINKEDFEEGKTKDIVTSRATPIKTNSLVRKNMSTSRQPYGHSPTLRSAVNYKDPSNPSNLYY